MSEPRDFLFLEETPAGNGVAPSGAFSRNVFTRPDAPYGFRLVFEVFTPGGMGAAIVFRMPVVPSLNAPRQAYLVGDVRRVYDPIAISAYTFTNRNAGPDGPMARYTHGIWNTTFEGYLFNCLVKGETDTIWKELERAAAQARN